MRYNGVKSPEASPLPHLIEPVPLVRDPLKGKFEVNSHSW
jgi:hypothetical protein